MRIHPGNKPCIMRRLFRKTYQEVTAFIPQKSSKERNAYPAPDETTQNDAFAPYPFLPG